jgi:hypothetical protein
MKNFPAIVAILLLPLISQAQGPAGGVKQTPKPKPELLKVVVAPDPIAVKAGESVQLTATVTTPSNVPVADAKVKWEVVPARLGKINPEGVFKGIHKGNGTVHALVVGKKEFGKGQGEAKVEVSRAEPKTLTNTKPVTK